MESTLRAARVTTPISCQALKGRHRNIPIGPCLVESIGSWSVNIIWGEHGQRSVSLPSKEFETAWHQGQLMLLD